MFEAGIIIFILGCVVRIWISLSTHSETKALSPQRVGERICAIKDLRSKMRLANTESIILMVSGAFLILVYGIFN